MPMEKHRYPANWKAIATAVKDAAGWKCQKCGKQCRKPGEPFDTHRRTLTVAHLNHTPGDCRPQNLMAMCTPCHLRYDAPHHAETRRRRRNAGKAQEATDAQEAPKDGHSGRENRECGEIQRTRERGFEMSVTDEVIYQPYGMMDEGKAEKYTAFLGHPLTQTEMRLVPYVQYCAANQESIGRDKVSDDEKALLSEWTMKGWCACYPFNVPVSPTREFWQFMCDVLWDFYTNKLPPVEEQCKAGE